MMTKKTQQGSNPTDGPRGDDCSLQDDTSQDELDPSTRKNYAQVKSIQRTSKNIFKDRGEAREINII